MHRLVPAIAVVVLSIAGCNERLTSPSSIVASLRLQPASIDLAANGGQASLVVGGVSADGAYMDQAPRVLLFVRDTAVATVAPPMLVIGRRVGTTYLIAQASDGPAYARDSILVRVGQFQGQP